MSDEPRKRTATEAMRLRPAGPSRAAVDRAEAVAGARALDELLELHSAPLVRLCRECLIPFPCRTRRLLEVVAGVPTPPEDASQ